MKIKQQTNLITGINKDTNPHKCISVYCEMKMAHVVLVCRYCFPLFLCGGWGGGLIARMCALFANCCNCWRLISRADGRCHRHKQQTIAIIINTITIIAQQQPHHHHRQQHIKRHNATQQHSHIRIKCVSLNAFPLLHMWNIRTCALTHMTPPSTTLRVRW